MSSITIDGVEYDLSEISDSTKKLLQNLQVVNQLILQRNNELQVAETAKIGYARALERELQVIRT